MCVKTTPCRHGLNTYIWMVAVVNAVNDGRGVLACKRPDHLLCPDSAKCDAKMAHEEALHIVGPLHSSKLLHFVCAARDFCFVSVCTSRHILGNVQSTSCVVSERDRGQCWCGRFCGDSVCNDDASIREGEVCVTELKPVVARSIMCTVFFAKSLSIVSLRERDGRVSLGFLPTAESLVGSGRMRPRVSLRGAQCCW